MFTGIVEAAGTVKKRREGRLTITLPWMGSEMHVGQSISVNGCCLTVTQIEENDIEFDLSPETLDRTTFGELNPSDLVNLERSMKMDGALDGHIVTGHIDATGTLRRMETIDDEGSKRVWFDVPARNHHWLIEKGSVAIDGVSLTVNDLDSKGFSVVLIPHTLEITSFKRWQEGSRVNVEYDVLAKYIERILESRNLLSRPEVAA